MKREIYPHDKYIKARNSILAVLGADLTQFMIFIIGVSRVGKTTIQEDVIRRVPASWEGKVVRFEAPPKMTPQFTFKPFLLRYLEHLGDPFSVLGNTSYKRMTNYDLIDLIVRRIRQKGVKLVMVDEADLFVTVRGQAQAFENLQFLKSLVNITGIPHIFAGTPALAEFLSMEGQVINRSHVVRLAPYSYHNAEHVKIFIQILNQFEKATETPMDPKLKVDPAVLFKVTNGCVGALRELLIRMDAIARMNKLKLITAELIENFGYDDPDGVRDDEVVLFNQQAGKQVKVGSKAKGRKCASPKETKSKRPRPGTRKSHDDKVGGDL